VDKDEREEFRQTLKSMINTIEANKWTQITFLVKYELWEEFKTSCKSQGIDPHDALTAFMLKTSSQ
jgi:hypothetical protein